MANIYQIGAGLVGRTMALDLSKDHTVFLADNNIKLLESIKSEDPTIHIKRLDVNKSNDLIKFIQNADVVLLAVPGFLGFECLKKIIISKKNVVDISFSPENSMQLDSLAKDNNVTAIIDAGVAPGIPNYILGFHNISMKIESFEYFVGGLPRHPKEPFNYKAPFSPIDVIEEYTRPARMMIDKKLIIKPALTDIESFKFKDVGLLEMFNTDGLRSILSTMSHIPNMREKTVRYPGHAKLIKSYIESGKFSPTNIDDTANQLIKEWKLGSQEEEFTVMDIILKSSTQKIHYHLFDSYDRSSNTSSMSRTTGYTATASINLLLNNKITKTGVLPPELIGSVDSCWDYVFNYLANRKVHIKRI